MFPSTSVPVAMQYAMLVYRDRIMSAWVTTREAFLLNWDVKNLRYRWIAMVKSYGLNIRKCSKQI